MVIGLPAPRQATFDDLAPTLAQLTFVTVDLETTGGTPASCAITEVGAVKTRGGDQVGELQTLVNPQTSIPAFIAVLTGITDGMVASAPTIRAVLPAFLEFARGSVLVAHNAPFDVGFLRAAAARLDLPWPDFAVVDTARLARRVLTRDEAPDCRLSTLARVFRTVARPTHRALDDARATSEVLHGLLERLGNLGVHSLDELRLFMTVVSPQQLRKRHLADGLPRAPGVYVFRDPRGTPLYIGKSHDVRSRVRQYFTASEPRTRMAEMVAIAERVDVVPCAHALEAEVRELRLIARHDPRYNRRSRRPDRATFVKLTVEPFPRLSIVRRARPDGAAYLGPFPGRRAAEWAIDALHDAFRIRRCSGRLPRVPRGRACGLAELGACGAPCAGGVSVEEYARVVEAVRATFFCDVAPLVAAAERRVEALSAALRYEEAARHRDRVGALLRAAARTQRLAALAGCAQLVAARPRGDGGWDLAVVRHGRLAGASVAPAGQPPRAHVDALVASAEQVQPMVWPELAATAEEMERLLGWLETPGTRIVRLTGEWSCPARGAAGAARRWTDADGRGHFAPLSDRRALRPAHRPARTAG